MILWTKNEMAENVEKLSDVNKNILPEFQKFLIERKLAPEKNVPFLAYWVSRFLGFIRRLEYPATEYNETIVQEFIETLRADKRTLDWQPRPPRPQECRNDYGLYACAKKYVKRSSEST